MRATIPIVLLILSFAAAAQPRPAKWVELYEKKDPAANKLPAEIGLTRAFFPFFDIGYQNFDYSAPLYPAMEPIEIDGGKLYGVYCILNGRLRQNPDKFDTDKAAYYSFVFVKDGQYDGVVHLSNLDLDNVRVVVRQNRFIEIHGKATFSSGTLDVIRTLFIHEGKLEDLLFMKPDDLRLARNFIFAFYGYVFKLPEFQQYFAGQLWYKPQYDDVNSLITEKDKALVAQIQLLEKLRANNSLAH